MQLIYQNAKFGFNSEMTLTNDEIRKLNLKILIEEIGKKSKLAEMANTDPAYISQILSTKAKKPRNIGDDLARKLELACKKPRGWMDTFHPVWECIEGEATRPELPSPAGNAHETFDLGEFRQVPVVGIAQLGDNGHWTELEYPVGHGDGHIKYPTRDKNAYALRCVGDSMKPRIKDGEFVIVEPNSEYNSGDEVLIKSVDGRVMVKTYLYTRDGRVHLMSVNEAHPPQSIPVQDVEKIHLVIGISKTMLWVKN